MNRDHRDQRRHLKGGVLRLSSQAFQFTVSGQSFILLATEFLGASLGRKQGDKLLVRCTTIHRHLYGTGVVGYGLIIDIEPGRFPTGHD